MTNDLPAQNDVDVKNHSDREDEDESSDFHGDDIIYQPHKNVAMISTNVGKDFKDTFIIAVR